MKTIFLISAQMQSGKDTFGDCLLKQTSGMKLAFADPVKEIAILALDMPGYVAYGGEAERRAWTKYEKDARQWLQWIGSECGRQQIDPDIWVDRMVDRIRALSSSVFVITDARFKNEIFGLSDKLGEDYRVVKIRLRRPGKENDDPHPSEAEQMSIPDSDFDEVVVNQGTIQELEAEAARLATRHCPSAVRRWGS